MKLAIAQLNPTIGDVRGNTDLVLDAIDKAKAEGADLLITPELVIVGYPPRDLRGKAYRRSNRRYARNCRSSSPLL